MTNPLTPALHSVRDADIERLRLLVSATAAGRQIGQVASLSNEVLREMVSADARALPVASGPQPEQPPVDAFLAKAIDAVEHFDGVSLESTLRTAALRLPSDQMLDCIVGPLLTIIGNGWHEGRFPPANGHLATVIIRRVLNWMTDYPTLGEDAPVIVVGTPAFQMHDLGAMLAATAAAGSGWPRPMLSRYRSCIRPMTSESRATCAKSVRVCPSKLR